MCGADCEYNGVVSIAELSTIDIYANIHTSAEASSLGLHLGDATIHNGLLHFEFRNPVAQQSTDSVCTFIDRDGMPSSG